MSGVATVRILIALLWILLGVWFQTTGLVGESSANNHRGNVNNTNRQVTLEDRTLDKENSQEDLDTFYEYAEPDFNKTKSEQTKLEKNTGDEWMPEYDEAFGNLNITFEEVVSTSEVPPDQTNYAATVQSQASIMATSTPTKSYQWEEEKYLSLGLNPKIEVSIEILHNDSSTRPESSSSSTGAPIEPFDESPISATATYSTASEKIATTSVPGISRDLGLLPFAIQSLDKVLQSMQSMDSSETEVDICERWIHCPGEHLLSDLARLNELPNCPCMYSFDIHYKDEIWDIQKRHNYRWRDASGPNDRVDIFHVGAKWCIRSLISDGSSSSMAAQQCCYDHKRHLITRGNGAGTPYVISPEVSRELHHKADVIPWIICKGDWTRYHIRRSPNNGQNCRQNPSDNVYFKQIQKAKNYR